MRWCLLLIMLLSFDVVAQEDVLRKNGCFRCHAVAKEKEGKSWKAIAKKYKTDSKAVTLLTKHMLDAPDVKIDGEQQPHEIFKPKHKAEESIQWILKQ